MNENRTNDARQPIPPRAGKSGAALAAAMMHMLDEIDYALVLVAGDGTLRYANQLGLHELTSGGVLQLSHGLVRSRHAGEQGGLQQALAEAVRGLRRLMTLGHDGTTVPLAVVPVPAEDDGEAALALLVFGKRPAAETLTLDFYARSHGLTGAETQVLKGLCAGLKPKEIANGRGVEISTVRSHICSIRLKTQTSGIRELVNRIARLPPITPKVRVMLPAIAAVDLAPPPAGAALIRALGAC